MLLDLMLSLRFVIAHLLAWGSAILLGLYLAAERDWSWYLWFPACVVVFLLAPLVWDTFLGLLEKHRYLRLLQDVRQPPSH
jgi:hypothetical protein